MTDNSWVAARDRHVQLYRSTNGAEGGTVGPFPVVLVTVTGRKTGAQHTVPVAYVRDGDDVVIAASKAGADSDPVWFGNIVANPSVKVQIGADEWPAHATIIREGAERDRLYGLFIAQGGAFADYEKKTTRVIPVVRLTRD